MDALEVKLAKIVGAANVSNEKADIEAFASDKSFVKPIPPRLIVKAYSGAEVEAIIKLAKDTKTPVVTVSSGAPHFRGDTVPSVPEAIILDLSGMKKVLNINKLHRMAVIEPGVTYGELAEALQKEGLELAPCLAPRATKSVVGSLLELEPRLNAMHQWAYTDPLRCVEVTWGDGNRMYTGEAGGQVMDVAQQWQENKWQVEPLGPMMLDFYRLLTGAQGTMGAVTWASVRCELAHQAHKAFLVPAKTEKELIEFIYQVVRKRFSDELFLMNSAQLASLAGENEEQITSLKAELPPYIAVVGVGGRDLLPQERMQQQEADIKDIAQQLGFVPAASLAGVSAEHVFKKASQPCTGVYWKDRAKGSFQDIFFTTVIDKIAEYIDKMYELAAKASYKTSDIGIYVQPVHCGSAYHIEFTLPYNPNCKVGTAKTKALFFEASETFSAMGAFYSRPYGNWSELQMNKDAMGKKTLDTLKKIFDPEGIMNPGKLCL
ncbi:MAG: FAD-binding oxidoreductase [Oscillospiraceae bacterium]